MADYLQLVYPDGSAVNKISILDINGKILLTQNYNQYTGKVKIDVSGLSKGVYLIKSEGSNVTGFARFVK